MLTWDVHLDLVVVLDVTKLRASFANQILVSPCLHFDFFMRLTRMSELMVAVCLDAFHHFFRLSHIVSLPCKGHLILLLLVDGILGNLGDGDFNIHLAFEGLDRHTLLSDEVWERRWMHLYALLLEVLKGHSAVALLDELLDRHVSHLHSLLRARNGKDLTVCVDSSHASLLLDHLDLGTFWPNDNSDLVLRHFDGCGVETALLCLLLLKLFPLSSALGSSHGHEGSNILLGSSL
mmetsp:Transcript_36076/g.50304  ORF Transcript_36076/g.50304 Transcript_36076/m.50304 type:complete len:235 (-) Transcript_36076:570-1274(-)